MRFKLKGTLVDATGSVAKKARQSTRFGTQSHTTTRNHANIFIIIRHNAAEWLRHLTIVCGDGTIERRFWQVGGGYDQNIIEDTIVRAVIDDINLNPVRRGLVERPEDWERSSARWYAGIRSVPIDDHPPHLLRSEPCLTGSEAEPVAPTPGHSPGETLLLALSYEAE